MLSIIAAMAVGVAVGYALRRHFRTKYLDRAILGTVALLLFLMGVSVGGNRTLLAGLSSLGVDALVLAAAGTLGSVLAGAWVYRKTFKNRLNA